jgi:Domain of unknown function (DUF4129)
MHFPSATTGRPAERHRRTLAAAIALTLLVCVVAIASSEPLRVTPGERTATPDQPPPPAVVAPSPGFPVPGALPPEVFVIEPEEPGAPVWLRWAIAAIVLAGALGAVAMLVRELRGGWRRRRGRGRQAATETTVSEPSSAGTEDDADAARRAVEAALEPLREPADPRAAVIQAYARMEHVLAERELAPRMPEAPREYLRRVLRAQGMPERSLTTLTALFEEARFSLHPIPHSAPRRALSELENARAAMAARDEHR